MGTNIALISTALLVSTFPLAVLKVFIMIWLGGVLSLLIILGVAAIARWLILPYADPALYRLITEPHGNSSASR